jgi:hypothetical protein
LEVRPSIGHLVVHAKWVTTGPMLLHDLGYTAEVLGRVGLRRDLAERHRSLYESLREQGRLVRDCMARAFTEQGDANYALTTAIAEVHTRATEICGVVYTIRPCRTP